MEKGEDFQKIIDDFVRDLVSSYPEYEERFRVIDYDEYYAHCKEVYPENFFNILYENVEMFDNDIYLLPDTNFAPIFRDNTLSENSKKTIWKYLQLILFCVCKGVEDKSEFGDANLLFEAINEKDLQKKIEETMNDMKNVFMGDADVSFESMFGENMEDMSGVENLFNAFNGGDVSGGGGGLFGDAMNEDELKDHLSSLMGGKIGALAKEIAEEASKEFGISEGQDEKEQSEMLQGLFKNPGKLLNIVKNIGGKLEEKLKSGDLKESELLEEAQEIMSKMKDMPGIKNMMKNMGMGANGQFDMKGMANKMSQNLRQAKMKERMKEKMKRNAETRDLESKLAAASNVTQVSEDTFVWNDDNCDPTTPLNKSSAKKKKSNNKKKKKKNKN